MAKALRHALPFAALLVIGCEQKEPESVYDLKEVIGVQGICFEDTAHKAYRYAGNIIRLRNKQNGTTSGYGSVTRVGSAEPSAVGEADSTASYDPPHLISFYEIKPDDRQDRLVLRGFSYRGREAPIYAATCKLNVVKRTSELPSGKN